MNSRRLSRRRKKKPTLLIILIILIIPLLFLVKLYGSFLFQLIFTHGTNLKQAQEGMIHVLLLGIGGGNHDGPNLTDSMIFTSIDPKNDKVTLISIPRDLWIPDIKEKINAAYAIGQAKQPGDGLHLAKAVVSKLLNQEVNYAIRIDFGGFVKAIDQVGGLDVEVVKQFDDYEYPIEGKEEDPCGHSDSDLIKLATASSQLEAFPCRYIHIHFDKGLAHMDGQTALEYVRSRHALGEEGTDFARSRRQATVILAFKDKLFSLQTIINPTKVLSLYSIVKNSIDTDISQSDINLLLTLMQKMKGAKIVSSVIDMGDPQNKRSGFLINPSSTQELNNSWVLIPRVGNGNFSEIQSFVACQITKGSCIVPKAK